MAPKQLQLSLSKKPGWGGRRKGAGRKRSGRRRVAHRTRTRFSSPRAIHVTLRMSRGTAELRRRRIYKIVRGVFCQTAEQRRFRICHYSVQSNHIHLVVETSNRASMTRGMRCVNIRLAKQLNRAMGRRKGRVFADRYHERHLESPAQVRNGLAYVLNNYRRHLWQERRERCGRGWIDPCSSGAFFDGWRGRGSPERPAVGDPVRAPRTFLLRELWRRRGLIRLDEIPGTGQ